MSSSRITSVKYEWNSCRVVVLSVRPRSAGVQFLLHIAILFSAKSGMDHRGSFSDNVFVGLKPLN